MIISSQCHLKCSDVSIFNAFIYILLLVTDKNVILVEYLCSEHNGTRVFIQYKNKLENVNGTIKKHKLCNFTFFIHCSKNTFLFIETYDFDVK